RRRCRLDLLLPAEPGGTPRRRHLGRALAGVSRPRLPTASDHRGLCRGLAAAQAEVLPEVPCRGDVFHVLNEAVPLVTYLENRAYEAIAACAKLQRQQAQHEWRHGRKAADVAGKLGHARPAEARAVALAEDVALLVRWLREDIL